MSRFEINRETVVAAIAGKLTCKPEVSSQIANFIVSNAMNDITNVILKLILSNEPINLPEKGDYIMTKIPYGHEKSEFNRDVLEEMGLLAKNRVFGIVKGSGGYRSEDDKYYYEAKIDLLYHTEDKKIKKVEKNISIFDLELIEKSTIPYFNGQNIKKLTKLKLPRVADVEEDDNTL